MKSTNTVLNITQWNLKELINYFLFSKFHWSMTKAINTVLFLSYNAELDGTFVGATKLEKDNNNYSISNKIKFNLRNENDKYLLG